MLKKLIRVIKELLMDFRYCSDHVSYARKIGVNVGNDCKFLCNVRKCFGNEPYLITIGDHVEICDSVRFMPHDGGLWVFRKESPNCALYGSIIVGDNVFIGINSIILPGVEIGNNVVIGAGAVVTKNVPDNTVYAGVPARQVNTIEKYKEKKEKYSFDILKFTPKEKEEYLLQAKFGKMGVEKNEQL